MEYLVRVPGCEDGARPVSLAAGGDTIVVLTDRHEAYQLDPCSMSLEAQVDELLGDLPRSDQVCDMGALPAAARGL